MTRSIPSPEFDPRIADWLEEDPNQAPDAVLETVLAAVPSIPQRRASGAPWRHLTMNRPVLVGAAAVLALAAVSGVILLRPNDEATTGGASPSVQPSSSASVSAMPASAASSSGASPSAVQTVIAASTFVAPFQMTWDIRLDKTNIKPDVVDMFVGTSGMNVFRIDRVGRDPCHSNDLQATPTKSPQAFMDWLATIPRTTHGPVTQLTVSGHPALERVITVGSLTGCIDTAYLHSGIVAEYGAGGYFMTAGEVERWIALDSNGVVIAMAIWPDDRPFIHSAADRAIATMTFTP
jgi:hypothetical protein